MQIVINQLESQLNAFGGNDNSERENFEKEIRYLNLSNELLEAQVKELQSKYEQNKEFYDNLISKIGTNENPEEKFDEEKTGLLAEIKILQEKLKNDSSIYSSEINVLTNRIKKEEHEKSFLSKQNILLQEQNKKINKENQTYSIKQEHYKNERNQMMERQSQEIEKELNQKSSQDNEKKLNQVIFEYEIKIEELNRARETEIAEIIESNEDLKRIIEEQKHQFDNSIRNEKENFESMINEFEKREGELLFQIQLLHKALKEQEFEKDVQEIEKQNFLMAQKILALENYVKELKEENSNLLTSNNEVLEKNMEKIKFERNDFMNKIDSLNIEILRKSEEIMTLEMKIEQHENTLKEKENAIMYNSRSTCFEKKDLQESIEIYRKK
jgi:hypothetical protein